MSNSDVNIIVRKLSVRVLAVVIIAIGGMFVKDHFSLANKVTKEEYWKTQHTLTLMVEEKTRILESIAKTNKSDIAHLDKDIQELKSIQKEIDRFLRESNRGRGYNPPLPEY